jgi:hypothetical protein
MGKPELDKLIRVEPWSEGSSHRNLSCYIKGSRYKKITIIEGGKK